MAAEGTGDKLTPRGKASRFADVDRSTGQRHTAIRAELTTPGEIPAAVTSAEMFWTKLWKSPPQRAANEGLERVLARKIKARRRSGMGQRFLRGDAL